MRLSRLPPRGVEGWTEVSTVTSRSSRRRETVLQVLIFVMSTVGRVIEIVEWCFFDHSFAKSSVDLGSLKLVCAKIRV